MMDKAAILHGSMMDKAALRLRLSEAYRRVAERRKAEADRLYAVARDTEAEASRIFTLAATIQAEAERMLAAEPPGSPPEAEAEPPRLP